MYIWEGIIDEIKVGASEGGIACGPASGNIIAEIKLHEPDDENAVSYHALAEVDGTLNFYENDESLYDQLICDDFNEDEWSDVEACEVGGYSDYDEFFDDLKENETCDAEHEEAWRLLVFLVRAEDDEVESLKTEVIGKPLGKVHIPTTDVEQEYKDAKEAEKKEFEAHEEELLESIRADYVGRQIDVDNLDLEEGESPAGDYDFEDTLEDGDYNEYRYSGGYSLDENGVITDIWPATCEKLIGEDARSCTYEEASAGLAYEMLRDHLDDLM